MQSRRSRNPLRRAVRGATVIAVLTIAVLFGFPDQTRHFMQMLAGQPEELDSITVYPYNFTDEGIDYLVSPGLIGYLPPGKADGKLALKDAYVPQQTDKGRVPVRWRYVAGADAKAPDGAGAYSYNATLDLPPKPSKAAALVLRFYPDGKIAARYTTDPEVAAQGNVDPALAGSDWKTNRP